MPKPRKTRNDCITNPNCPAKLFGLNNLSKKYRDGLEEYNKTIHPLKHCDILCHDVPKIWAGRNECPTCYDANRNHNRNNKPTKYWRDSSQNELRRFFIMGRDGKISHSAFAKFYAECHEMTSIDLYNYLMTHPDKEIWMNSENYGSEKFDTDDDPKWNIEHIKPRKQYRARNMKQAVKNMHAPSNLRPIRARDNH